MSKRGMILDNENDNQWGFKGKNYLLVIGIDEYAHWKPLKNAVKDARDFIDVLKTSYQFEEENITTVFNQKATEKNILRTLKSFVTSITDKDNIIIYYSGHGHYDDILDEGYWVPVDAPMDDDDSSDYISNRTLSSYLKKIKAHHTLLLIDSCFSGSILSGNRSGTRSEKFASFRIFASGRNEVVEDGVAGQNSPFAASIIQYLKSSTLRALKTSTLIEEVKDMMEHRGVKQTPIDDRAGEFGDAGGEFIFYQKRSEEDIWKQLSQENTAAGYERYMSYFPEGIYYEQAVELVHKLKEKDIWELTQKKDTYSAYEHYLEDYPGGKYHKQAREKLIDLKEKKAWNEACRLNTIESYDVYLKDFFDHPNAKLAEDNIVNIQKRMKLSGEANAERKARLEARIKLEKSLAATKANYTKNFEVAEQLFSGKKYSEAKIKYLECQKDYQKGFEPDANFLKKRLADSQKYEQLSSLYKSGKEAEAEGKMDLAVHYYQKAYQIHKSPKLAQLIKNASQKGGKPVRNIQPQTPKKSGSAFGTILKVVGFAALALIGLAVIGLMMEDGNNFETNNDFTPSSTLDNVPEDEVIYKPTPPPAPTIIGNWTCTFVQTDFEEIPPLFVGALYAINNTTVSENGIPMYYSFSNNQININNSSVAGTVSFRGTNQMIISGLYISTYPCVWTFERL